MTNRTVATAPLIYARVAGFAFLFYIVAGIAGMSLPDQTPANELLSLMLPFAALVLAVTLYALTRAQGPGLALLALTCRVAEAVTGDAALSAIFFAVGSLLFCWLFLRGRMLPAALAWLGVLASVLLVGVLPLQQAGLLGGPTSWSSSVTWLVWLPMLVFEIALALWLMIKGVALPAPIVAAPHPEPSL
jgi:hypothetical protein